MLSIFDGKDVRVTTSDGSVFTGTAEAYPSGYGLHEFGVAEESLCIGDTMLFLSEIVRVEPLDARPDAPETGERCLTLASELLEGPYWIADILTEQVPKDAAGQYFAVDRYFRQPERLRALRRKQAEILLRLNCRRDMTVSFDSCEHWETNPDPARFAERLEGLSGTDFLRAVFLAEGWMIDIEPDDTYMTVYSRAPVLPDDLQKLCAAEGLFLWQPPEF